MRPSLLSLAAVTLVRTWTRIYTAGLPPRARDGRRRDIDVDLWDTLADAERVGERGWRTACRILGRLPLGIADDLSWRLEHMSVHRHLHLFEAALVALVVAAIAVATVAHRVLGAGRLPVPANPPPSLVIDVPPPPLPSPPPPPPSDNPGP